MEFFLFYDILAGGPGVALGIQKKLNKKKLQRYRDKKISVFGIYSIS